MLLSQLLHLREGGQLLAAADDDGRRLLAEQLVQCLIALFRRQPGQKVHLCQTHDLQTQFVKIIIVARQEQTRAIDLGDLHADLIQFLRRIDHFHADTLDQRFQRDVERTHPSFPPVLPLLGGAAVSQAGTAFLSLL